jgi:hypothetical protein
MDDLYGLKRRVLAVGAALTLFFFLKSAGTLSALIHPPSLLILGWCLLPIGHLLTFGREDDREIVKLVLFCAAAMVVVFGIWVYVDMTMIRADAQGTTAFLIVPLMQMAVAIPAILAAWILRRRSAPAPA